MIVEVKQNKKEKAQELVEKFLPFVDGVHKFIELANAKQCALIAVEEIINSVPSSPSDVDWDDVGGTHQYYYEAQREEALQYWEQVKQEIEALWQHDK